MMSNPLAVATFALLICAALLPAQGDTAEAQQNPLAGDSGAIAAGKALYDQLCQNCHGASAVGIAARP